MQTLTWIMALSMGLAGSLHCAGMCGPIMWVMPFQSLHGIRKWGMILLYHLGRVSVYASMGVILFSFRSAFTPQIQQYISITAGLLLLILGLLSFLPNRGFSPPWTNWVSRQLRKFLTNPHPIFMLTAGVLNGLLPCGLVYMALAMATTAGSAAEAAGMMYLFGIGTMPILFLITIMKQKLIPTRIQNFRKYLPVVMFCMGALFMIRGMNLGIPYLSPAIDTQTKTISGCCHK